MAEEHPIEITPPEIASYRIGNTGVDYVHVLDSGKAGPNVMIQPLTHGNEFCGAIALDCLPCERVTPRAGRLTLAFAKLPACYRRGGGDLRKAAAALEAAAASAPRAGHRAGRRE